jgi:hypothetical protein
MRDLQNSYITVHYKPREFRNDVRECDLHSIACGIFGNQTCKSSLSRHVSASSRSFGSPTSPLFSLSSGSGLGNNNLARHSRFSLLAVPCRPARRRAPAAPHVSMAMSLIFPTTPFYSHFAARLACTSRVRLHDSAFRPLLF